MMSRMMNSVSPLLEGTRAKILELLKRTGPMSAEALGKALNITSMGIRLHLQALEKDGLVTHHSQKKAMGRPGYLFSLTPIGDELFPRTYSQVANHILDSVRQLEGEKGIDRIFRKRVELLEKQYRTRMTQSDLQGKVAELARIRSEEGYMAEWEKKEANTFILRELNCAICQIARQCIQACNYELLLFQKVLPNTEITRTEHIVKGDRMCTYTIRKKRR
jgi:iron-sulfur cluster biosynthesis transcriptional regulator SufR